MQVVTLSKTMLRLSIACGAAICISGPSIAKDATAQKESAAQIAAGKRRYQQAETKMGVAYRKLVRHSKPAARRRLKISQSLWVRFRDAECRYEVAATPPNDFPSTLLYQCMWGLTINRTERLEEQLECPGVDGTC